MTSRTRKLTPHVHLPLRRLAMCLDCDECFEIGAPACPACGSETWTSLSRFFELAPSNLLSGLVRGSRHQGAAPNRQEGEREIARTLFVVAHNRAKLYDYVKRAFSGNSTVRVVLDRRGGERRQRQAPPAPERRRSDRRARFDITNQLRALGWAIVLQDVINARRQPSRDSR
jgi:hypothetical protein